MKTNRKTKKSKMTNVVTGSFLLTSLLFAGCSAEDTIEVNAGTPPVELTTPLTIASAQLDVEVSTRATTVQTTELTSGSIGVFVADANGYTAVNNSQYTYNTGTNKWGAASTPILLGGADASICAYYPYKGTNTSSSAIPLQSAEYLENSDLCYAINQEKSAIDSPISFSMKRAYSRLKIQVGNRDYPGTSSVSSLVLRGLYGTAALNITDGTYTALVEGQVSTSKVATVTSSSNYTDWIDCLLVPFKNDTDANKKITIELTVDGQKMLKEIPDYTPQAGKYSTLKLTLRGSGIEIGSVTTEDWINENLSDIELAPTPTP